MKEKITEEQNLESYQLLKDRYLIGDLLKKGEYTSVYRAYDTVLAQETIIRELISENPKNIEDFTEEAGYFFGEYEYRGTAEVTDVFHEGTHAYLAMEYLPGQNLRQYLHSQKNGQLTMEEAWLLLLPVLELLSWMHSIGIVHGGIIMDRLIFNENGILCLTGIGDGCLRCSKIENPGPWSDVQAVSDILYECLTGKTTAQAKYHWNKYSIRPISTWAAVSSRVDSIIREEVLAEDGEGSFCLHSLAGRLGMPGEALEIYLGAIRAVWGEKWLDLTEKYQKEIEELDRTIAFMTRNQKKIACLLLGILLSVMAAGWGYVHTHERQILDFQIQKDHEKYQEEPVFLLPADSRKAEEIWEEARKEGTTDPIYGPDAYRVDPEFMEKRNLSGNAAQGFSIRDTRLKKLMEEVFALSLEEKSFSQECSVLRLGDKKRYLEICNQKDIKYGCAEKEKSIEIVSDRKSGRVNSCTFTLSREEIKLFFKEIFPQIIPETYVTDAEAEAALTVADQENWYDFSKHGKYEMSLMKRRNYTEEDAPDYYSLELASYASEVETEEEKAAGSYDRSSADYQSFMKFVKEHAIETKKNGSTIEYKLSEDAVRAWNQPSNLKFLKKTRKDFIQMLENQGISFQSGSEWDWFQVTDAGMGAVETRFLRDQMFETETGDRIRMQYDLISERIYKILLFSKENKNGWSCDLAAKMVRFFSEDCSESAEQLTESIEETVSRTSGARIAQQEYTDAYWIVVAQSDTSEFIITACDTLKERRYSQSEIFWPQKGETDLWNKS